MELLRTDIGDMKMYELFLFNFGVTWRTFLTLASLGSLGFLEVFGPIFWNNFLDQFLGPNQFLGPICWTNLIKILTNILMNFDFSVDFYLTYNILTVPSFRIGVPSILFITLEIKTFGLGSRMNRF